MNIIQQIVGLTQPLVQLSLPNPLPFMPKLLKNILFSFQTACGIKWCVCQEEARRNIP